MYLSHNNYVHEHGSTYYNYVHVHYIILLCTYIFLLFIVQLLGGPIYPLRLTAQVTLPMMEVSLQDLDFGTVLCGQCRIITLRLYNPLKVK